MASVELSSAEPPSEPFPFAGMVRRVRRICVLSQRELAEAVGVGRSTIGQIEAGSRRPGHELFDRILALAGLRLVVVDGDGRVVQPIGSLDQPHLVPPRMQYGIEGRLAWFPEIGLPEATTQEDMAAERYSSIAGSNHQHPDHDTAVWPARSFGYV